MSFKAGKNNKKASQHFPNHLTERIANAFRIPHIVSENKLRPPWGLSIYRGTSAAKWLSLTRVYRRCN